MTVSRRRFVGMELHSDRPGDSAAFYAWLLGPGIGAAPQDWNPISLLFSHGVCGVWRVEAGGPPASWVPVIALDDVEAATAAIEAEGGRRTRLGDRTYLVDPHDVWTRVVPADAIPLDVDPDAVGETNADYFSADPDGDAQRWAARLGMEPMEILDDVDQLHFVVSDRRPAFGTVCFVDPLQASVPQPSWVVYFAVPDIPLAVQRAAGVGSQVAIPPSHEEYNDWCVLVDPFGVAFGLSIYYATELSPLKVRTPRGEELFSDAVDLPRT